MTTCWNQKLFYTNFMKFILFFFLLIQSVAHSIEQSSKKKCFTAEGMYCGNCVAKISKEFRTYNWLEEIDISLKRSTIDMTLKNDGAGVTSQEIIERLKSLEISATEVKCAL